MPGLEANLIHHAPQLLKCLGGSESEDAPPRHGHQAEVSFTRQPAPEKTTPASKTTLISCGPFSLPRRSAAIPLLRGPRRAPRDCLFQCRHVLGDSGLAPPPYELRACTHSCCRTHPPRVGAANSAKSGLSEMLIVTAFITLIYSHGKSGQGLPMPDFLCKLPNGPERPKRLLEAESKNHSR